MFTSNPFSELSAIVHPSIMQTYVVVMVLLVALGTIFDVIHKKSAKYFFLSWKKGKNSRKHEIHTGEVVALLVKVAIVDSLMSAEFCNWRRRLAHLLTMYGFFGYIVATLIMVFAYPTPGVPAPTILPLLWHLGAIFVCIGGYWFWFFIRVDVAAEGNSPFRVVRADLFVLALLASVTLGLAWSYLQTIGSPLTGLLLGLYLIATTVLFGSVPWSKFSHMFFKPAAALQKRVAEADGSRSNLPNPAEKPEVFGSARRLPRHY